MYSSQESLIVHKSTVDNPLVRHLPTAGVNDPLKLLYWSEHEISVLVASASSDGSCYSVHVRRIARAFAARIQRSLDVGEVSNQTLAI